VLIRVPEQTERDLAIWAIRERADALNAQRTKFRVRAREAMAEIGSFAAGGPCYAGVSWGKDSTVLASLVVRLRRTTGVTIPLVWVVARPRENPHCALVRDAFFAVAGDHPYEEIESWCEQTDTGWSALGTLERGFARAAETHGVRYVSGIRGDESAQRAKRMARYGVATQRTCAPIGRWSAQDVWAYLHAHDLPVHPAYAMSMGGLIDRDRIRVATLGGRRGDGWGRATWEWRYYHRALDAIGHRAGDDRPR